MQPGQELKQIGFNIDVSEAAKFAGQWKHKGLFVPLADVHHQYATDFANVALQSFIEFCKQQTLAKIAAMREQAAAAPQGPVIEG